jgi:phosphoketolase
MALIGRIPLFATAYISSRDLHCRAAAGVQRRWNPPPDGRCKSAAERRRQTFDSIFTTGKPVVLAFHACPRLIHRPTYHRTNHHNIHVRGYNEEGTTTPFDMTGLNDLDRFHLAGDVIGRVPRLACIAGHVKQRPRDKLVEHRNYVDARGDDLPEARDWRCGG